jgi:hypothetical protein
VHEKPVLTTDVYEMDSGDIKARIAEIIRENTTEGTAPANQSEAHSSLR